VLVPLPDARAADAALRARGIALRPFTKLAGIGDALRITIGRRRELEAVLEAFAELAPGLGLAIRREVASDAARLLDDAFDDLGAPGLEPHPIGRDRVGTVLGSDARDARDAAGNAPVAEQVAAKRPAIGERGAGTGAAARLDAAEEARP